MKKKLIIVTTIIASLGLTSCGSNSNNTDVKVATNTEISTIDNISKNENTTFPLDEDITNAKTISKAVEITLEDEPLFNTVVDYAKKSNDWIMISSSTRDTEFKPMTTEVTDFTESLNKNLDNKIISISTGDKDLIIPDGYGIFVKFTEAELLLTCKVCAIKNLVDNKYSIMNLYSFTDREKTPTILESYEFVEN